MIVDRVDEIHVLSFDQCDYTCVSQKCLNRMHSNFDSLVRVSANKFFRYDSSTFRSTYLMKSKMSTVLPPVSSIKNQVFASAPLVGAASVNWATDGFVTAIKDQGECGETCWG